MVKSGKNLAGNDSFVDKDTNTTDEEMILMLKIEQIDNKHYPVVRCDSCGKLITDGMLALVTYDRAGGIRFLHKNVDGYRCDPGDGPWMELETFLVYLADGLNVDLVKAERIAGLMASMAL